MNLEDIEPGQCVPVDWSETEYHGAPCLSRSVLGLLDVEPLAFRDAMAGRGERGESSDDMRLGTLLHLRVLEPGEFMARVLLPIPRPEGADGRAAAGTEAWDRYMGWQRAQMIRSTVLADNPQALDINEADAKRIDGMVAALHAHPEAAALLSAVGDCERSFVWREPETGLLIKLRPDKIARLSEADVFATDLAPGLVSADLKTSKSERPLEFARSARQHGYLEQAALYTDAITAYFGEVPRWYWTVVTNVPVYRGQHAAAVYEMTPEQHQRGRERYMAQVRDAALRLKSNDWRADHRRGIKQLKL